MTHPPAYLKELAGTDRRRMVDDRNQIRWPRTFTRRMQKPFSSL